MIFAHGWWVQGGEKMSKSLGNVVDPVEIVRTYRVDPYRYFLLSEAPFGQDGTFSEQALIERYNTALANDLGNLLHRTLTMCEKYFQGSIPPGEVRPYLLSDSERTGNVAEDLVKLSNKIRSNQIYVWTNDLQLEIDTIVERKLKPQMQNLDFYNSIADIWSLINQTNRYIEISAPWKLSKESKSGDLKLVIRTLMEVLRVVSLSVWPFMPYTGETIWRQLGIAEPIEKTFFGENMWGFFEKGGKVAKGNPIFPRIELEKI
jgi:methionyl-tRNA synthetase